MLNLVSFSICNMHISKLALDMKLSSFLFNFCHPLIHFTGRSLDGSFRMVFIVFRCFEATLE